MLKREVPKKRRKTKTNNNTNKRTITKETKES